MNNATTIYNQAAPKWVRKAPNILTDFSVRPLIFNLCNNLTNKSILDLGCGEGYVSRYCKTHGAANVIGIDISSGMIEKAQQEEQVNPLGIKYQIVSAIDVKFMNNEFDVVLGIFVFNYLTIIETQKSI